MLADADNECMGVRCYVITPRKAKVPPEAGPHRHRSDAAYAINRSCHSANAARKSYCRHRRPPSVTIKLIQLKYRIVPENLTFAFVPQIFISKRV